MNTCSSKACLLVASIVSVAASMAGDERVNCREEISDNIAIYAGQTSCDALIIHDITDFPQWVELFTNVSPTTNKYFTLTQVVTGWDGLNYVASCIGTVPFSHFSPVYQEVCDYTPEVHLSTNEVSAATTRMNAVASDRDGSIVSYEWWINGVKQSSSSGTLTLNAYNYGYPHAPIPVLVRVRVTDDDGYTDEDIDYASFKGHAGCDDRDCGD